MTVWLQENFGQRIARLGPTTGFNYIKPETVLRCMLYNSRQT